VDNLLNFYKTLPKVELHRHLEGSLRLDTLQEIARLHRMRIPGGRGALGRLVQVQQRDPGNHDHFLAKFSTLRKFFLSPEIIQRVTREAVQDAARDNVRYLELRFTPLALSLARDFPLGEVMDWVCESARLAARGSGILVRLIASVNRHESPSLAEQVACLAAARITAGILGLDLAGNEAGYSAEPFAGIIKEAYQSGLKLTVHAGEWSGADSVGEALLCLNVDRIGHGVRIIEDPRILSLARERGAAFEVCVTSNFQTGVIPAREVHPVMSMVRAGLNVTVCTDNPSISQATLSDEYRRVCEDLEMGSTLLKERILSAARAGFLPEAEREKLVAGLQRELGL